ncbi:hypothetical protein HPB50_029147 [Hyalomma asiaticum]|nr:hypothetical protein HPB50_029147 [Hyalomma asiaticum]
MAIAGVHVADMVMSGTLRHRSAILFCCSFVSFAMVYNLSTGEVMRTNHLARAVLVVLRLPAIMMGVPFITYAGRRRSLALSMFAMSLLALALSGVHAFGAREGLLAAVTVSWLLVFDVFAITMFIISSELYPTVVRGSGFGLCYTFGRMGAVVAPFVNEIKSGEMKGVAYAIAALLLLISGAMAWTLPETTKLLPANTIRDLSADKWAMRSPLRIARIGRRMRPKGENRDRSKVRSKLSNAPGKDVQ